MPKNAEKELISLENQYWQALKDNDATAAVRLTDDPCIVAGAQGVARLDHKRLAAMLETPSWVLKDFELKKMEVHLVSDDVAIVAYQVHEEVEVEGNTLTLEASDCSTWVRRGRRWVCAAHTEAIAGDPFGRDRRAA